MCDALTGIQFTWAGQKYRVDLPNGAVEGPIKLPNAAILMIKGPDCQPFAPTEDEFMDAIRKFPLPQAEKLIR